MTQRDVVVDVENVSKRFCRSFRHSLWYGVRDIAKELSGRGQEAHHLRANEFWALRDVSFAIGRGEAVGLIGHNGAGKTTLLKLINGLIKPTQGKITVDGSVRALIALGTGFNPVLTGRENIRIASAVLGYGEKETEERFEEIVAFSDIGEFIDAPVQSYSSGMLARLGFSVAVHTRPDIMLVDEVLAVGDLNFALKCYRKIADFRHQGGSIILVSHNPYAIRINCDRVIWIEKGTIQAIGDVGDVCDAYELAVARQDVAPAGEREYGDGTVRVVELTCPPAIRSGDEFTVELKLASSRSLIQPILAISFSTVNGQQVVANIAKIDPGELAIKEGESIVRVKYDSLPLVRGVYSLGVIVAEQFITNQLLAAPKCGKMEVESDLEDNGWLLGVVRLHPKWDYVS